MPGVPMHSLETPASVRIHPPRLGEHTKEVLREHGYDDADIERLKRDDVV